MKWFCLQACVAAGLFAQPVMVYSEFAVINEKGEVTAPEFPREILSPAVARNAFASFQVVIDVPEGTPFVMHVGQNPENAVKSTLYRRVGEILQPVQLPYESKSAQVLWLDIWLDKNAPVRRIKIEPQVRVNDDWAIYPMEVRVRDPQVPDVASGDSFLAAEDVLRAAVCGTKLSIPQERRMTTARLRYRNAQQDAMLAGLLSKDDREEIGKRLGGCNAKTWSDPEAYLHARDYLLAQPWEKLK